MDRIFDSDTEIYVSNKTRIPAYLRRVAAAIQENMVSRSHIILTSFNIISQSILVTLYNSGQYPTSQGILKSHM